MATARSRIAFPGVIAIYVIGIWLTACGGVVPGPSLEPAHPDCQFPAGTGLAFSGTATLEGAGLGGGPVDADVGQLYVTADPIRIPEMDQNDLIRRFCIIYPESEGGLSQVSGLVPDDWTAPAAP